MAGHIALPEYVKYFNPEATTQELYMPATLSKYILTFIVGKMQVSLNSLTLHTFPIAYIYQNDYNRSDKIQQK